MPSKNRGDDLDVDDDVVALVQHPFDAESLGFDEDDRVFNVNAELFRMPKAAQRRGRRRSDRRKNRPGGAGGWRDW